MIFIQDKNNNNDDSNNNNNINRNNNTKWNCSVVAAILLGHLKKDAVEVKKSLLSLDEGLLTPECLKQLIDYAPDEDEVRQGGRSLYVTLRYTFCQYWMSRLLLIPAAWQYGGQGGPSPGAPECRGPPHDY